MLLTSYGVGLTERGLITMLNDKTDNTKKNESLLIKLALAYESRGEKLHPALKRITNHIRRVDCIYSKVSCKHYVKGKCRITNLKNRLKECPTSNEIYLKEAVSDSGLPPKATSAKDEPLSSADSGLEEHKTIFKQRVGRGFSCIICGKKYRYKMNFVAHLSKLHKKYLLTELQLLKKREYDREYHRRKI